MRVFLLVAAFVVLTVPLTWLWTAGFQDAYTAFLGWVAAPLLEPLGATEVGDSPAQKRFISFVPFLVLMVITPRLSLTRRLVGLGVGTVLIFLCHVGVVIVEAYARTSDRPTEDVFSSVFPAAMFADAFPFILWAIIAHGVLRDFLGRAFEAMDRRDDSPPG